MIARRFVQDVAVGLAVFLGVGLLATVAHELGHYLAWWSRGYTPVGFEIYGLGAGVTTVPQEEAARATRTDLLVGILGGPVGGASVLLAASWTCLRHRHRGGAAVAGVLVSLFLAFEATVGFTPWLGEPTADGRRLAALGVGAWTAAVGLALLASGLMSAWACARAWRRAFVT